MSGCDPYFFSEVDAPDELRCPVCREPVCKPIQVAKCQHIGCLSCMKDLTSCPVCRCSVDAFERVHHLLVKMAHAIEVQCEWCHAKMPRSESFAHMCLPPPPSKRPASSRAAAPAPTPVATAPTPAPVATVAPAAMVTGVRDRPPPQLRTPTEPHGSHSSLDNARSSPLRSLTLPTAMVMRRPDALPVAPRLAGSANGLAIEERLKQRTKRRLQVVHLCSSERCYLTITKKTSFPRLSDVVLKCNHSAHDPTTSFTECINGGCRVVTSIRCDNCNMETIVPVLSDADRAMRRRGLYGNVVAPLVSPIIVAFNAGATIDNKEVSRVDMIKCALFNQANATVGGCNTCCVDSTPSALIAMHGCGHHVCCVHVHSWCINAFRDADLPTVVERYFRPSRCDAPPTSVEWVLSCRVCLSLNRRGSRAGFVDLRAFALLNAVKNGQLRSALTEKIPARLAVKFGVASDPKGKYCGSCGVITAVVDAAKAHVTKCKSCGCVPCLKCTHNSKHCLHVQREDDDEQVPVKLRNTLVRALALNVRIRCGCCDAEAPCEPLAFEPLAEVLSVDPSTAAQHASAGLQRALQKMRLPCLCCGTIICNVCGAIDDGKSCDHGSTLAALVKQVSDLSNSTSRSAPGGGVASYPVPNVAMFIYYYRAMTITATLLDSVRMDRPNEPFRWALWMSKMQQAGSNPIVGALHQALGGGVTYDDVRTAVKKFSGNEEGMWCPQRWQALESESDVEVPEWRQQAQKLWARDCALWKARESWW